jgi:tryptophanyl-tRNA synthetase
MYQPAKTSNLSERFDVTYSETFTVPAPITESLGARIMLLKSPERKMSKSNPDGNATICIINPPLPPRSDSEKIAAAVTDSGDSICADPERPGIADLRTIYCIATHITVEEAVEQLATYRGYALFKWEHDDALIARLESTREHYAPIRNDTKYLQSLIRNVAETVQPIGYKTLAKVYGKIGFSEKEKIVKILLRFT